MSSSRIWSFCSRSRSLIQRTLGSSSNTNRSRSNSSAAYLAGPCRHRFIHTGDNNQSSKSLPEESENGLCHVSVMMQHMLDEGCDFKHWRIYTDPLKGSPTKHEIIRYYIKILAQVVGNEEEARKKMYSAATKHYYAFGANISKEQADKLRGSPDVIMPFPDAYVDKVQKRYPWDHFVNDEALPRECDSRYYHRSEAPILNNQSFGQQQLPNIDVVPNC